MTLGIHRGTESYSCLVFRKGLVSGGRSGEGYEMGPLQYKVGTHLYKRQGGLMPRTRTGSLKRTQK